MIYRHMNAKDVYTTTTKNNMQFFKTYFSVLMLHMWSKNTVSESFGHRFVTQIFLYSVFN